MIKVTVLYPYSDGCRFEMGYYLETHCPRVGRLLGEACKGFGVEEGLAGAAPGTPPAFKVIFFALFESVESFQAAFGPHAAEIMGDIPTFTDLQPIIQVSAVRA
jgi:uncharacterized protein (TIGR02118 family)